MENQRLSKRTTPVSAGGRPKALILSIIILSLLFALMSASAQDVAIVQHASFCDDISALAGYGVYKERILSMSKKTSGRYSIEAIVVRRCGQPIIPVNAAMKSDTLVVRTVQATSVSYQLESGDTASEVYNGAECDCAYTLRMEVVADSLEYLTIDGKLLEMTDEKYLTYPKRYFIFQGDTTGYEDEYGRRQGYYYIQRKKDILKSLYKDGDQISCELLTLEGKLIAKEKDCFPFIKEAKK